MLDILRRRTRRIMLGLILDDDVSDEGRKMDINGSAGVGMAYLEAAKLDLLRLTPGSDPECFRFSDIAAMVDGVWELIDAEEARAYADLEEMTGHHRLRLRTDLRRLEAKNTAPSAEPQEPAVWVGPPVWL